MSDIKTNLVQSADGAARVGVLFVAVAMFAAMWESDSPPASSGDNWMARRAGVTESVAAAGGVHSVSTSKTQRQLELDLVVDSGLMTAGMVQGYPMPVGIAPGEYRVVDSFGMTGLLSVTSEMVAMHLSPQVRDQYIVESGGRKIFFIRIQNSSTVAEVRLGSIPR